MEWHLAAQKCTCQRVVGSLLLRVTLSSLSTYFLEVFTIPTDMGNRLEKMQQIIYGAEWGMNLNFIQFNKTQYALL